MIAPITFLRRSPLKSTLSDRYNPIISRSMRLGRPKRLPLPPIVLERWDLPCCRKRGEISYARFRRPVSCDQMLGSTIARRRWRCEGPNPLGRQVASRSSTRKSQKEWCNTRASQEVTHPRTNLAKAPLIAEFCWDPVH